MEKAKVVILTTGGTIEKSYSEEDGSIINRESIFKQKLLSKLRLPHTEVEIHQIMAKDSLEMTEEDRQTIAKTIEEYMDTCDGMVILHGTDTMDRSLSHCFDQIQIPAVPIVFTGAMRPAGFDDSDAQQNVTEALLSCQFLAPGLYLSFHGHVFPGPWVKKDRARKTFVMTRPKDPHKED